VSVEPEQMPSPTGVIEAGRDDIGSDAPDVLPPADDESKLAQFISRAAVPPLKLLGMLPAFGGVAGWAAEKLSGISKSLNEARFRELERLRKMLEKDPDEGLRHAIPLRDVGTRGRATPGWRLGTRDVNFSLSSLFGGGGRAGDPWYVPPDMVARLTQRYREAANRELRLGRYRRAAYIFAELLGDFPSAATALEQGRHFREAALLYRDHLKNARKAAECLEHGGLLSEAIAIYDELGMHEKSGDLHTTLEQYEAAAASYRAQVVSYVSKHQLVPAAGLLETKLKAPEEALELLTEAWPWSDSAGECLRESFALLARLGRHAETSSRLGKLRGETPPAGKGPTLANVLSHVATTYPEESVRLLSADATRVVAAAVLPGVEGEAKRSVARAVARVAPEDRLLARDVERFLAQPPPRPALPPPRRRVMRSADDPVVLRQFRLPDGVTWRVVVASPGNAGFLALGSVSNGVLLLRGTWEGITQSTYWKQDDSAPPTTGMWQMHPLAGTHTLFVSPAPRFGRRVELPQNDAFPTPLNVAGSEMIGGREVRALAHAPNGLTWVLSEVEPHSFVLGLNRLDKVLSTFQLDDLPTAPPERHVNLAAHEGHVAATWGTSVVRFGLNGGVQTHVVDQTARTIVAGNIGGEQCFVVGLEEAGWLLRPDGAGERFGDGLTAPFVTFTRGGMIVAADGTEGRVYRAETKVTRVGRFDVPAGKTLAALTPTDQLHGFALFTTDGNVQVFQVPR
jgi:tetratricopeptide (TPR) repeat protein